MFSNARLLPRETVELEPSSARLSQPIPEDSRMSMPHDSRLCMMQDRKMAEDDGWIKLHRKFTESDTFQHPGMWHLFCWCMAKANYRDKTILVPGTLEKTTVKRGSLITGRNALHEKLYPHKTQFTPSPSTLWRWLQSLEEMGSLKLENLNNRCTLVTVCQYELYNSPRESVEPPVNRSCPAGEPPVGTKEELNNNKESKEGSLPLSGEMDFLIGFNDDFQKLFHRDTGKEICYRDDPMVWQWQFILQWNDLTEVATHSDRRLSSYCEGLLHQRFQERDWDWKSAMGRFPVNFQRMSLVKFLELGTVQKLNDGGWAIPDFVKGKNRVASTAGVTYDPNYNYPKKL